MLKRLILTLTMIMVFVSFAEAVTYTNNTSNIIYLKDSSGTMTPLQPGSSIQTIYYSDHAGLIETSELPYWNWASGTSTVTVTAAGTDVAISATTEYVIISQITGTITVFLQDDDNTPAILTNWTEDEPVLVIPVKGRCDNLEIEGSGTCEVTQYTEGS